MSLLLLVCTVILVQSHVSAYIYKISRCFLGFIIIQCMYSTVFIYLYTNSNINLFHVCTYTVFMPIEYIIELLYWNVCMFAKYLRELKEPHKNIFP
jgi:hypothetical protein